MIESMIAEIKPYLPLKIVEVNWDETVFQIHGADWHFVTLSAWRISTKNKMILGCLDNDSMQIISLLKDAEIVDVDFQNNLLKIDLVFILSDNQRIEIFSTDTYEPWVFAVGELPVFVATPGEPNVFSANPAI